MIYDLIGGPEIVLGGYLITPPANHLSMRGGRSLVDRHLMALTNFTDGGNYLIARSMLAVNPPRRQIVMDSERQLLSSLSPQNVGYAQMPNSEIVYLAK